MRLETEKLVLKKQVTQDSKAVGEACNIHVEDLIQKLGTTKKVALRSFGDFDRSDYGS